MCEGDVAKCSRNLLREGLDRWPASLRMTLDLHGLLTAAGDDAGAALMLDRAGALAPDSDRVRWARLGAARDDGRTATRGARGPGRGTDGGWGAMATLLVGEVPTFECGPG